MPWTLAAALAGGVMGLAGAKSQNRAASQQSARQMAFQERMSSTAYQRAAKDLEAAGLNRILALGSPASSPGGAQAPVVNKITSAMGAAQAMATVSNISSQTKLTDAQTQKSLDDNYIKHNAINALRSIAKGGKPQPSSAKDKQVQPGFVEKYITGPPPDWSGKSVEKTKAQPNPFDAIKDIKPLPPMYSEADKRAEFNKRNNEKHALRSRQREAMEKWLNIKKRSYLEMQEWKRKHPLSSFRR